MADQNRAQEMLVEAGLFPQEMPENYTFKKVRKLLAELGNVDQEKMRTAIEAATGKDVSGALAVMIFIKHHLGGSHKVEVDRLEENEEGVQYAVLVYPEGELPIKVKYLPKGTDAGSRLLYLPTGFYELKLTKIL